jgi:hypothetical protein
VVVGAAGGRPLRGGRASGMSSGEWHGFRQEVERVSVLSPVCSLKITKSALTPGKGRRRQEKELVWQQSIHGSGHVGQEAGLPEVMFRRG